MTGTAADRDWFEKAVLAVLPELVGTARRLARNREDAEDLAAEAITRAWLHRGSLRERQRFAGWILRILTNLFISRRRSDASRHEETGLDEETEFSLFERLHQPFLLWWGTPEQDFLNRLLREDLVHAIEARGRALLQKALWEHACDAGLRSGALDERPGHA
jgi:RNA polymerase sigma-70 factor, ECF subfamily